MEEGTSYSKEYPFEKIVAIIKKSLQRIEDKTNLVRQDNRQKVLQGFGVIRRKKSKSLRHKIEATNLVKKKTEDMEKRAIGIGILRRDGAIFFDDLSLKEGEEDDKKLLRELLEDETLPVYALQKVENTFNFKTPLNLIFASYKPERDFIKKLVKEENAKIVDSWIKSPDIGFYSVEYSWRKGEHPKQGSFNPDFFIKIGNDILVIEIKSDDDLCDENKAKLKHAQEHFERLNNLRQKQKYYFKFLSPESYDSFFQYLRKGKYQEFVSEIEAKLEEKP